MAKKKRSKAEKIRTLMQSESDCHEIARKVGVTFSYVNWVRWYDQNRLEHNESQNDRRRERYNTDEAYRVSVVNRMRRRRGMEELT